MSKPVKTDCDLDRRRAPRAALRLSATIREPGRSRVGVRIIDMSTHGCRVEASSGAPAEAWVLLSVAGLESQYCRIVWRAHEFAGLEFASPIAEAVLDRLLQDQDQQTESTVSELRSIANRTHRLATSEDQPAMKARTLGRALAQMRGRRGGRGPPAGRCQAQRPSLAHPSISQPSATVRPGRAAAFPAADGSARPARRGTPARARSCDRRPRRRRPPSPWRPCAIAAWPASVRQAIASLVVSGPGVPVSAISTIRRCASRAGSSCIIHLAGQLRQQRVGRPLPGHSSARARAPSATPT